MPNSLDLICSLSSTEFGQYNQEELSESMTSTVETHTELALLAVLCTLHHDILTFILKHVLFENANTVICSSPTVCFASNFDFYHDLRRPQSLKKLCHGAICKPCLQDHYCGRVGSCTDKPEKPPQGLCGYAKKPRTLLSQRGVELQLNFLLYEGLDGVYFTSGLAYP